jgi:hypothetical protein
MIKQVINMKLLKQAMPVLLLLLTRCGFLMAQEEQPQLISGSFQDYSVQQFAEAIESQTSYKLYFDPVAFDSIRINLTVKSQPIQKVLQLAFEHTNCKFSIDSYKRIYLLRGQEIATALPKHFFEGKPAGDTTADEVVNVALEPEEEKSVQQTTLENKLIEIGIRNNRSQEGTATIAGYVRDDKTGEPLAGVSVVSDKKGVGTYTDQFGYFAITLPKGRHTLNIQSLGKRDTRRLIQLNGDGKLNIDMHDQVISLKEVIISASKASNVKDVTMGVQRLNIKVIKQVPSVFGEADILKVMLTLPGVKSVGEASTGFNVRGGSADQNLILFNDATIYNPSHFFGFFSAFNPDIVKDVELYKSSIPAKYGGRLSSVLDISSREGNKKGFSGSAGIGPVTSRFNLEGPLIKDRTSFMIGARSTYADWLLKLLPDEFKNSKASFYDINLNIAHQINKKNNLYLTGYLSKDSFSLNNDTTYGYSNNNVSLKWKHEFNTKFFGIVTAGYDRYRYTISSDNQPISAYQLGFDINQANFKVDFNYYASAKHSLDFGVSSIYYKLHPGTFGPTHEKSLVIPDVIPAEQALESAIYLGDKYTVSPNLSFQFGVRYSLFSYMGPQTVNLYANGIPKTSDSRVDSVYYPSGSFIKTYGGPEFRASVRYALSDRTSIKAGYNSLRQYIHMLSNTTAIAPTDIWKLSDPNIRPEYGDQFSLGLYSNFKENTIETSVEVYYKRMRDYLDYKSGASLVLNHSIETDVINTSGKAYGIELMVKKLTGKLNGWLSYTYSRALLRTTDSSAGELVNHGAYYPANFDKPHDVTAVGNYRFSHRFSVSMNITYSTGRPITLPIGRYFYGGSYRALYSERNAYRIPDYFRADISMNIEGNHKVKQRTHNSWTIGLYNLTGRKNPYSVYFVSENGVINGYKLSIFGTVIPFVNFNIRF